MPHGMGRWCVQHHAEISDQRGASIGGLVHVGLPEQHRSSSFQPAYDLRILVGYARFLNRALAAVVLRPAISKRSFRAIEIPAPTIRLNLRLRILSRPHRKIRGNRYVS